MQLLYKILKNDNLFEFGDEEEIKLFLIAILEKSDEIFEIGEREL